MVKLGYTILYVKDVAKAVEFYEKSFGLERKFMTPENDYAELKTGETTLAFASIELAKTNLKNGFSESSITQKPFGIELAFITDNVEKIIKNAVQYGAHVMEEPVTKPWGQIVAYIRDVNGFLIEICTPIDPQG